MVSVFYFLFFILFYFYFEGNDLFDDDLQKDVISPLLTSTGVSFLRQCLNSRQRSIWEACGPAWTTPRYTDSVESIFGSIFDHLNYFFCSFELFFGSFEIFFCSFESCLG